MIDKSNTPNSFHSMSVLKKCLTVNSKHASGMFHCFRCVIHKRFLFRISALLPHSPQMQFPYRFALSKVQLVTHIGDQQSSSRNLREIPIEASRDWFLFQLHQTQVGIDFQALYKLVVIAISCTFPVLDIGFCNLAEAVHQGFLFFSSKETT